MVNSLIPTNVPIPDQERNQTQRLNSRVDRKSVLLNRLVCRNCPVSSHSKALRLRWIWISERVSLAMENNKTCIDVHTRVYQVLETRGVSPHVHIPLHNLERDISMFVWCQPCFQSKASGNTGELEVRLLFIEQKETKHCDSNVKLNIYVYNV